MVSNGCNWSQVDQGGQNWKQMSYTGPDWSETDQNQEELLSVSQVGTEMLCTFSEESCGEVAAVHDEVLRGQAAAATQAVWGNTETLRRLTDRRHYRRNYSFSA